MSFQWKDEYNINIEEIDNQHKKLFSIGRRLHRCTMEEVDVKKEDIDRILKELKDYVVFHFDTEERLMMENDYLHYQSHKNEHEFFKKEVERLENRTEAVNEEELLKEILNFVFTWILNHILKVDKRLIEIIK